MSSRGYVVKLVGLPERFQESPQWKCRIGGYDVLRESDLKFWREILGESNLKILYEVTIPYRTRCRPPRGGVFQLTFQEILRWFERKHIKIIKSLEVEA